MSLSLPRINLNTIFRAFLWGVVTLVSASAAVWTAISPSGIERMASIGHVANPSFAGNGQSGLQVAQLEQRVEDLTREFTRLNKFAEAQNLNQTAISTRIASVENNIGSIANSILDPRERERALAQIARPGSVPGGPARAVPTVGSQEVTGSLGPAATTTPKTGKTRVLSTTFAIELMSSADISKLEQLWAWARDAGGADVAKLSPRLKIQQVVGGGNALALIAGPIKNAQDAARLCLLVKAVAPGCKPVPFSGQTLALQQGGS